MTDFSYHPDCRNCPLWEKVSSIGVGGEGMDNPVILFVGEGPGKTEDELNRPFVGDSGQLLRSFIQGNGSDIQGYITVPWRLTNAVRCRPYTENVETGKRKDRKPKTIELNGCQPYLIEEIKHFNPKVIVPLGESALIALLGDRYKGITRWRGNILDAAGYLVIPTFHPSFVSRAENDPRSMVPRQFEQDMKLINEVAVNGKPKEVDVSITVPKTLEELRRALDFLEGHDELSFDVETNSYEGTPVNSIWSPGFKLLSISFACSDRTAVAIPLFHKDSPFAGDVTLSGEYTRILKLLESKRTIAHNGKFDMQAIWRQWGKWIDQGYDTMLAHYMLEEERGTHDLETLMKTYCKELAIWKAKKDTYLPEIKKGGYEVLPLDELLQYNAYDTLGTFKIKGIFSKALKEYPKRESLFTTEYMPISLMLARVEAEGLRPDFKARDHLKIELEQKKEVIVRMIKEVAESYGMKKFNPASTKQMVDLLYSKDKMYLPKLKFSEKTGTPSTDDDTLLQLRTRVKKDAQRFIDLIISHMDIEKGIKTDSFRGLAKLLGTYINPLEEFVGEDGMIHTSLIQTGTATGRLSSKDPNMQNLPPVIRKIFGAPEGYKCVEFDYSQAELRLLSMLAHERVMKKVFLDGGDIHQRTTKEIYPETPVMTSEMRRKGKETNFGIVYRESAKGLAEKLNCTVREAQRYIDAIFSAYPALKNYFEEQEAQAREYGFVETPFGNVRHLRGAYSKVDSIYADAMRQAVNSPIQGGAGLINLHKMARLAHVIDWKDCKMVLNVHDSIWFYIRFNESFMYWVETIKAIMEDMSTLPFKIDIPMPVDVKVGDNFYELNKMEVVKK